MQNGLRRPPAVLGHFAIPLHPKRANLLSRGSSGVCQILTLLLVHLVIELFLKFLENDTIKSH